MNWTGGGLSRSRYGSNPAIAKQNNYFAKVRSKLHTARPSLENLTLDLGHWKPQSEARQPDQAYSNYQERQDQSPKRKRKPSHDVNTSVKPKRLRGNTGDPIIIGSSPSASSKSSRGLPIPKAKPVSSQSPDPVNGGIEALRLRLAADDDCLCLLPRHIAKPMNIFPDPKDRDLIGKRRPIPKNDRSSQRYKRPLDSRVGVMQKTSTVPTAIYQYPSQDDPSVRIGSLVDRSEPSLKTKSVTGGKRQRYAESNEILDTWKSSSPAQIVLGSGSSGTQSSRHRHHEAPTPSAPIYDDSSSVALSPILEEIARGHSLSISPSRILAVPKSQSSEDSYWNLNYPDYEPQQNPSRCRLVFEDTPRPVTRGRARDGSSPVIRDFAYVKPLTPNKALDISPALEDETTRHSRSPANSDFVDMFEESDAVALMATGQNIAQPDMFQDSLIIVPVATSQGEAQADEINSAQAIADDKEQAWEEAWKRIMVGDKGSTDWTVETYSQIRSTQDEGAQTQPSLIAEIDTSPFKQNPHMYPNMSSHSFILTISSPKQGSESSEGTTGSPEEQPHQSNKIADLSSSPSNSSLEEQATLPDNDDTPTRLPPVNTSLVVEASSSPISSPSTDEISRPSERTVGAAIRERIQSRVRDDKIVSQQEHSTHHNKVDFTPAKIIIKKPARYIGSELPKQEVLGSKMPRSGRSISDNFIAKKEGTGGATTERRQRSKLSRRKTAIRTRSGRVYGTDLWLSRGEGFEEDEIVDD